MGDIVFVVQRAPYSGGVVPCIIKTEIVEDLPDYTVCQRSVFAHADYAFFGTAREACQYVERGARRAIIDATQLRQLALGGNLEVLCE